MTRSTALGSLCAAAAATMLLAAPAAARHDPHHGMKQVCKVEKHHGKRIRTCHWVRR